MPGSGGGGVGGVGTAEYATFDPIDKRERVGARGGIAGLLGAPGVSPCAGREKTTEAVTSFCLSLTSSAPLSLRLTFLL